MQIIYLYIYTHTHIYIKQLCKWVDSKKLKAKRTIYKHCGLINQVFHMGIEINNSQNQYICLLEYVNK